MSLFLFLAPYLASAAMLAAPIKQTKEQRDYTECLTEANKSIDSTQPGYKEMATSNRDKLENMFQASYDACIKKRGYTPQPTGFGLIQQPGQSAEETGFGVR